MRLIRKFLALNVSEKKLIMSACLYLCYIRMLTAVFRFKRIRRYLDRDEEKPNAPAPIDHTILEKVAWAVKSAGRHLPGANTCLIQALVVRKLLARRGIPSSIRFGVCKNEEDILKAHAWVESCGEVVIGGAEAEKFKPLKASEEQEP